MAAAELGIEEIYKIGSPPHLRWLGEPGEKGDLITGPGNIYVTTAKKLVYGEVNIDMLAGPSEIYDHCRPERGPSLPGGGYDVPSGT